MAVEDAGISQVFKKILSKCPNIPANLGELHKNRVRSLSQPTIDAFLAGVIYLTEEKLDDYIQDNHIQRVATTAWWIINSCSTQEDGILNVVHNIGKAAVQLGMSPTEAGLKYHWNDEPEVFFESKRKSGILFHDIFKILITPEFLLKAQDSPTMALAAIAGICSKIKDLADGRYWIDPENIEIRANATKAHFLRQVQKWSSETEPDEENRRELLNQFPAGIDSLPENLQNNDKTSAVNLRESRRHYRN